MNDKTFVACENPHFSQGTRELGAIDFEAFTARVSGLAEKLIVSAKCDHWG
jgi:hypothetical protein